MLIQILRRIGLPRLLRIGAAGSLPPLWTEIAVLHFRGSFSSRWMWIPVIGLPIIFGGGGASALMPDELRSRKLFRPFAWLLFAMGAVGSFFHARGVGRQMGGYYNWKYNAVTGPPLPAPMQIAVLGAMGLLGSNPPVRNENAARGLRELRVVNAVSYLLLAVESGYNHWTGSYFNKVMFTPVILGPLLALVHLGAVGRMRAARALEIPLSLMALAAGIVGFGFHVWNIAQRPGGFRWQNFFYGPPVVAPLQLTGQGALGLVAALLDKDT